jgi:hypothetical protein
MASVTLSVKYTDNNGVIYADPSNPNMTVRFKSNVTQKTLGGTNVPNYSEEIIANDQNAVTIGSATVYDALSVKIRVSGSLLSKTRLANILNSMAAQCATWNNENVMQGFRPTTAPVITTP